MIAAMTARDWAVVALASSGALALFIAAVVISNLFRVVTSLQNLVDGVASETVPLLKEASHTVAGVNKELERVDVILGNVQRVSENAETISDTVRAVVTNPLVKALAFAAGARRATRKFKGK
ncbi:MAG: DUF948 domain-containing protein [Actinomycetota bacterium]